MCVIRCRTQNVAAEYQLPIQVHPRLAELDRIAAEEAEAPAPVETPEVPAESAVEPVESPAPVEPVDEARSQDNEEDFFLKIDKRQPYQSLRQLADQEKSLRDAIETMVGRKAKAKYEPELEALRAELEVVKRQRLRDELKSLDDEAINERFRTDPNFAQTYAREFHSQDLDPSVVQQDFQTKRTFLQELERAEAAGVLPERLEQVETMIKSGQFAYDPQTRRPLTPVESYRWIRNLVDSDIAVHQQWEQQQRQFAESFKQQERSAASVEASSPPAPAPNPRLQEASPDMSAGTHVGGSIQRMSKAEWKQMTPSQRFARWPTNEDFQKEVSMGLFID